MSCKGGCGFHGNPNTNDMCSKCFRDYMQKLGVDMPNPNMKPSAEGKASVTKAEEKLLLEGGAGSVSISIRLGDLTVDKVDAIVNAANRSLSHASGLAGAIVKKGGEIIQDESDIYIAEHGKLDDGGVMYTHAGKLPCKYIIHTVGPMWRQGREGEEQILALAVRNTLDLACKLKCASVTIPAISSGIFGFPKEKCGKILYDTVVQYIQENVKNGSAGGKFTLRDIRLTNFDDQTVDVFVRYHATRQKELKEQADKAKAGAAAAGAAGAGAAAAAGDVKAPAAVSAGVAAAATGAGGAAAAAAGGAAASAGAGAALGAGGKLKILLLGDDLTAGFYGVYKHPVYGPHDAQTGAQPASYNNEPTAATVKYHGYIKRLTERLKGAGYGPDTVEPVARAYVNATSDVVSAKLTTQPLSSELGTGAFGLAVVLVGSHDVLGIDMSHASGGALNDTMNACVAQTMTHVQAIHTALKSKYRVAKTVALLLPAIDTQNVAELSTDGDRAAARVVRDMLNSALKQQSASIGYEVCDPSAKLPQGKATAALWDDAWHLSPAGSDVLGDAVFEHLVSAKLLPALPARK